MRVWECESCGQRIAYLRHRCRACGGQTGHHVDDEGAATLVSWTTGHIGGSSTYVVARLFDQLVPAVLVNGDPSQLAAGMSIRLEQRQNGDLQATLAGVEVG